MLKNSPGLRAIALITLPLIVSITLADSPGIVTERIAIDQFGYMPAMKKVAVISDPQAGFNESESYTPGDKLEVRRSGDNKIVFTASPTSWNNGATHDQSGDKVWWFDFSPVRCEGDYYIYDPANDRRSYVFRIDQDIYKDALKAATRVFFYQRCAQDKFPPHTDLKWSDAASHLQDRQSRSISAQNDASTQRDLSGGWYDAGDYNKYVTFTTTVIQDLLFAYERNPGLWTDDFEIPESGDGAPDILNEIKWELDWLLKMRNTDGSVLSKVAVTQFQAASPPSRDFAPRYYGAASTSATLSAAISFAHAAIVFKTALPDYATTLRDAAAQAWSWAEANPRVIFTNAGFASANPEVDDYTRGAYKLAAAIYLYALTGESKYRDYVEANFNSAHALQWTYWYAFEPMTQDALLYYTKLPGVMQSTINAINTSKQNSMNGGEFMQAVNNSTDAYRAYLKTGDYTWGSNRNKSHVGLIFINQAVYGIDAANATTYRTTGADYLHYIHGVNPHSMTFLTNMNGLGAENSANEMYHGWFFDRTDWDNAKTSSKGPAPGYLTGGANGTFVPDNAYTGPPISPPQRQPVQKAYKDWNTSWPENSWQITEPAIYYQAAYVNLLATVMNQFTSSGGRAIPGACRDAISRPINREIRP
ncbi:MAG TPA: glycoside hydrolase family 9 protein [Blastocatellia bacterium]|nr:glycoside hydrolase family 9 protein [Blastocatellia bacterium]